MQTKILILDDYAELLDVLTIFLEGQSFNVCAVGSEELFNAALPRFNPDIIILDVYIKGDCDGRNICKTIKNNSDTGHIPVILMSTSNILLKNYEECKADAAIDKPFDLLLLLEKIKALTNRNTGEITTKHRNEIFNLSLINKTTGNENKYAH